MALSVNHGFRLNGQVLNVMGVWCVVPPVSGPLGCAAYIATVEPQVPQVYLKVDKSRVGGVFLLRENDVEKHQTANKTSKPWLVARESSADDDTCRNCVWRVGSA